ncbi:hypothetical protein [Mammaliicoccus lentus]|uniref:hypothetical protein n=1 Tax=Mammaliicoccus lentus TaxID=42858 RepID=UPI001071DFCF|nr:hypothetical protein [Mammaliicoccus lentus]MBF0795266.1 hypothetical protein [Mammaliicoccus lentus]TFV14662.1 hypothetical protein E4T78_11400 [Mammaliicoccus lentus]
MFKRKKNNNSKQDTKDINNKSKNKNANKTSKSKTKKLTRAEKKELKRKRKEFKKTKSHYEVEGGIAGDRDPTTKRDMKRLYSLIIALLLLIGGIFAGVIGTKGWFDFQKNNTTKLGTSLAFSKTDNAKVKINEVWTDKNRDVTVAKLGYPNSTRDVLSNNGTSYKLHMNTKSNKSNIQMAYGILGSEGDGYLFIKGKLKDQPYNIGIENTVSLTTDSTSRSSSSTSSSSTRTNDEENLEVAISSMNKDGSSNSLFNSKKDKDAEKAKNELDFIKFIINPYSDNTKVYNGSFLTPSGDIDYSKIVSQTSVDSAIKRIDKQIEARQSNLEKLKVSEKEFEKRIKQEKKQKEKEDKKKKDKDKDKDKDKSQEKKTESESNLEDVQKSIKDEVQGIENLESKKKTFENADFDRDSFGDMQTKSNIY